jgi:hypothetical protein
VQGARGLFDAFAVGVVASVAVGSAGAGGEDGQVECDDRSLQSMQCWLGSTQLFLWQSADQYSQLD